MKQRMILADEDSVFCERLSTALNNRDGFPWSITGVCSEDEFRQLEESGTIDSILVTRTFFGNYGTEIKQDDPEAQDPLVIRLTECREDSGEPYAVCKYQSVSEIAEQLEEIGMRRLNEKLLPAVGCREESFDELTIRRTLHEEVMRKLDLGKTVGDDELRELISAVISEKRRELRIPEDKEDWFRTILFAALRRQDILSVAMDDDSITEIMVNGTDRIYVEKEGGLIPFKQQFTYEEKPMDIVQQIASGVNRRVNEANPLVDARLPDGSRVNIVLPPIALDGPCITIRRFRKEPIGMNDLIGWGAITAEAAEFLKTMVECGYNIFVSGGTGTGKTTFLGALSEFIPKDERVITIEDSAELQIRHIGNLVRLESRPANLEGEYEVTIRDLIRNALRMRPDRIIVGEIRSAEALDMLQAMNTGHDGSVSTGHANSAEDMIKRIETMVLMGMDLPVSAIRSQIATGIDIMIHLTRLRDRSRRVAGIYEVCGIENGEVKLQALFEFIETGESEGKVEGKLERTDHQLIYRKKLLDKGIRLPEISDESGGDP